MRSGILTGTAGVYFVASRLVAKGFRAKLYVLLVLIFSLLLLIKLEGP